jgi:uncharacterized protein (DUF1778 family)
MPLRTRTHPITFRLDADEYEELVKVAAHRGARSIAEFTRTAVLNSIAAESLDKILDTELDSLMGSLEAFELKVRGLRRHIRQLLIATDPVGS